MLDAEVAIIGGGPAGCATALSLGLATPERCGRIILLERAVIPRPKTCAGAVAGRADRLLERLEAAVPVPSLPIRGLSVRTRFGSLAVRTADGQPIGRVVPRAEFDAALVGQVAARGIAVQQATVTDLAPRADAIHLRTSAGPLTARVVVGADGVGSVVRRAMGLGRGE